MWTVLRDGIRADVALVQEAVPPEEVHAVWHPIDDRPRSGRRWGSAVVGFNVELEEVTTAQGRANRTPQPLAKTWPGSVAVAKARMAGAGLTFVSVYGLIDDGYADPTVNRQLSDLAPLFDDPLYEKKIVMGGDFNITTQWTGPQARYATWQAITFDRIKALGLVDCLDIFRPPGPLEGCGCRDGAQCRHIQTQRHRSSRRPWQNDYLFASAALTSGRTLTQAYVYDSDVVRALGDHMPLVADFEV
jgi:hypothetical protein